MRRVSAIVVFVVLAALTPFAAAAQEATPPPGAEVLGPEECRVSPRSPEAMLAVFATPAAEPGAAATNVPAAGESRTVASEDEFPTGEPADAATAAAVEAVVREAWDGADAVPSDVPQFSDYLLAYRALAGPEAATAALAQARELPDDAIDGAFSRSYLLAWLMVAAHA